MPPLLVSMALLASLGRAPLRLGFANEVRSQRIVYGPLLLPFCLAAADCKLDIVVPGCSSPACELHQLGSPDSNAAECGT